MVVREKGMTFTEHLLCARLTHIEHSTGQWGRTQALGSDHWSSHPDSIISHADSSQKVTESSLNCRPPFLTFKVETLVPSSQSILRINRNDLHKVLISSTEGTTSQSYRAGERWRRNSAGGLSDSKTLALLIAIPQMRLGKRARLCVCNISTFLASSPPALVPLLTLLLEHTRLAPASECWH